MTYKLKKFEKKTEELVKVVETANVAESCTDCTMLAMATGAVVGLIALFNQLKISPPDAKQIIHTKNVVSEAPQAPKFDLFYMQ